MKFGKIILAIALVVLAGSAMASIVPDISNITNISMEKNSDAQNKALDLRDFTTDPAYSVSGLFYSIEGETNPRLADCFLDDDFFIACKAPLEDSIGENKITVKVTNPDGLSDTDSFSVYVNEQYAFTSSEVVLRADRSAVTLENSESINVQLTAENNTPRRECFETEAHLSTSDRHEIEATIYPEKFCLDKGQSTTFTLTITAKEGSFTDTYDVEARIVSDRATKTRTISATVTDDKGPIDVVRIGSYYVCSNPYTQQIRIRLENNSSKTQTISLSAENEILLPEFEFKETRLRAGESDEMGLTIHTNSTLALTEYTIPVFARSGNYYVERDIRIMLTDCDKDVFSISVLPQKADVKKGQAATFKVNVTNKTNRAQEIYLTSEGDLPNSLEIYSVNVGPNSTKLVKLTVNTRTTDAFGLHDIKISAWNSERTESKNVQVNILREHSISMAVQNNDFEARQCSASNSQTFEITLTNNGDFDETVKLKLKNSNESIQAVLSDTEIKVASKSSKKFYVFIAPSFSAELGNYTVSVGAKTSTDEITQELRFRVVEADEVQMNVIEVLSYPQEVNLFEGETKTLSFAIRNPTGADMHNVGVRIFGLSSGATVYPLAFSTLKAGETRAITREITALEASGNRTFDATFEVKADGYVTTKNFKIIIKKDGEQKAETGILAGFASLIGDNGIAVGAIVLIVLILVSVAIASEIRKKKPDEASNYTGT